MVLCTCTGLLPPGACCLRLLPGDLASTFYRASDCLALDRRFFCCLVNVSQVTHVHHVTNVGDWVACGQAREPRSYDPMSPPTCSLPQLCVNFSHSWCPVFVLLVTVMP